MMIKIRRNTFETNSSSTHSITMCSKDEYDLWKDGKLYLNEGYLYTSTSDFKDNDFVTKEQMIDIISKRKYSVENINECDDEDFRDEGFYTFENFWRDELESFETTYKTKNGEEVVAFGQYGYDG